MIPIKPSMWTNWKFPSYSSFPDGLPSNVEDIKKYIYGNQEQYESPAELAQDQDESPAELTQDQNESPTELTQDQDESPAELEPKKPIIFVTQ